MKNSQSENTTTTTNKNNFIGQNSEKSLGDLRSLAVTQTSAKDHKITLDRKLARNDNNSYHNTAGCDKNNKNIQPGYQN